MPPPAFRIRAGTLLPSLRGVYPHFVSMLPEVTKEGAGPFRCGGGSVLRQGLFLDGMTRSIKKT